MTQGLVTIMKGGKVIMKIIACGEVIDTLKIAKAIVTHGRMPHMKTAYRMALRTEFGMPNKLVVINRYGHVNKTGEKIGPIYRYDFEKPQFNPLFYRGPTNHIRIVRL